MVGYDGGRIGSEQLADHVVITRSEHIPRIQEAQAGAYHCLRELVELVPEDRAGDERGHASSRTGPRRGHRAGRRLSALRPPAGRRARARRATCSTTRRGVLLEIEGSQRRGRRCFWPGSDPDAPPLAVLESADGRRPRADRRRRLRDPSQPARRAGRRAGDARQRDLRRLPARAAGPVGPALPLPVHQLHQLRSEVHDRARRPVRPPADDDGRLSDVRRMPRPSTRTRATGASTPSPTLALRCGPSLSLLDSEGRARRSVGRRARGRGRRAARRCGRRDQGDRRVSPRLSGRRRGGGRRAAGAQAPRGQAVCADGRVAWRGGALGGSRGR